MKPGPEPGTNSHFHAQGSDVVDLSLARVVQHLVPFQSHGPLVQCRCMCMTIITLSVQNLTLSSLKLSPHKNNINILYHIIVNIARVFSCVQFSHKLGCLKIF